MKIAGTLSACLVFWASCSLGAERLFDARMDFLGGGTNQAICCADFNADSHMDMAAANGEADKISVILSDGSGGFQAPHSYMADLQTVSIFAADVDNDYDIDLVAANSYSDNVSVFKNNGDGSFMPATNYGTGDQPQSIFAADINYDGYKDIITANYNSDDISVLVNRRNGTFRVARNYAAGDMPSDVYAIDLDADNLLDLVVPNYTYNGTVNVLINNGDSAFYSAVPYPAGYYACSIFAGDLDGDGDNDVAVTNESSYDAAISILMNSGNGVLLPRQSYDTETNPDPIYGGDFDFDGDIDLAVAGNDYENSYICVMENNGGGEFSELSEYETPSNPTSVCVADIDNDNDRDIIIGNQGANFFSVYVNIGNGRFAAALELPTGYNPSRISGQDFDGDGDCDLAVTFADYYGYSSRIAIIENNGDRTFQDTTFHNSRVNTGEFSLGDFDGDSCIDMAALYGDYDSKGFTLLMNDCQGYFQRWMDYSLTNESHSSIVSDDYDLDGDRDLAVTTSYYSDSGIVQIWPNGGDGIFQPGATYDAGENPASALSVDVELDGDKDLIFACGGYYSEGIIVIRNNGGGIFGGPDYYPTTIGITAISAQDINNDGYPDLAGLTYNYDTSYVSTWINAGDGSFQSGANIGAGTNLEDVEGGDFDGNAFIDLAVANGDYGSGNIAILLNVGGALERAGYYGVGQQPISVFVADFDGDDLKDIAVANSASENISILFNCALGGQGVDDGVRLLPGGIRLSQNYPNPFNAATTIVFELTQSSHVKIDIYDIRGARIAELLNRDCESGRYQAIWHPTTLPSGTYFYRLAAGDRSETRKMTLIK